MRTAGTIQRSCVMAMAMILFSQVMMAQGRQITENSYLFTYSPGTVAPAISDTLSPPGLKELFGLLHQKTGAYFLYSDEDIRDLRPPAIEWSNKSIDQILQELLKGTGLSWRKIGSQTYAILRKDTRDPIEPPILSKGRIVNAEGEPLPGASVQVKGSSRGTIANQEGYFELETSRGEILLISNVGYQSVEWPAERRGEIRMELRTLETEMEEVTLTALGISRELRSTGYSITRVSGRRFQLAKDNNLGALLSGLVAGVNSIAPHTGPGGSSRVTIRGNSSLSFDNQPLYVVNGIPINNDNLGNAGKFGGADFGDGIGSLNPDDVEELHVLKGGAAAALYGQRGRNGVILIETKNGATAQPIQVVVNSNTQFDFIRDFTRFQREYGQGLQGNKPSDAASALLSGLYSWGAPLDGSLTPVFNGYMEAYKASEGSNLQHFYQTGIRSQQTVAVSGATEELQWRVSLGDLRSQSVYPSSGYNRHTYNLNLRYQLSDKWSGHSFLQYSKEQGRNRPNLNDAPGNGNFAILFLPPNVDARWLKPGYDVSGNEIVFNDNAFHTNPWFAASRFRNNTSRDRILAMTRIRFQWNDWLYVQGRIAHDYFGFRASSITPTGTAYKPEGTVNLERNFDYNETNADLLLGIDKALNKDFRLNFTAGANLLRMRSTVLDIAADGLAFPFIYSPSGASNTNINNLNPRKNVHSLYGSLLLDWKKKLYLQLTDRQDWSSTLPAGRNGYNYPSVNIAWSFARDLGIRFADQARLRLAYSRVGGDAPLFATRLYYNTSGTINGNPIGDMDDQVPNANLKPLQVSEWEWGLDARFLDDRLQVDLAWYRKKTLNDIVAATTSVSSGFHSALLNVGQIRNYGVELRIAAEWIRTKNWHWNSAFNIAHNRNKVIRLSTGQQSMQLLNGESRTERAFVQHVAGLPFGQLMVFDMWRNEKGQPILNNGGVQPLPILAPAGTGTHPITGGWLNQVRWGRWELECLLDFKFGAVIYSGTYATAVQRGLDKSTLSGRTTGVILEGVDEAGNPRTIQIPAQQYYESLYRISAQHVLDADFAKLRSLSLSWQVPDKWLSKWKAEASLSLVGRNLFYLIRHTGHIDPESSYSNGNAQGLEYASLPATRSIGLHLQIRFK
jgi:TonB-linked SusC/RagA family outer membrane protein